VRRLPLLIEVLMNTPQPSESNLTGYFAGILGAFLIVALLVWAIYRYANPAPLGSNRAAERAKNLSDQRKVDADVNKYGWVDQGKGVVRLPIGAAVELTIKDYQNPAAAKKDIAARVDKFNPPPPPPAPEQPSKYE
jgi:hypothetical protein